MKIRSTFPSCFRADRRTDIARLLAAHLQTSFQESNIYRLQYQQVEVDLSPEKYHCEMNM
jgi:hypothetical protein